MDELARYGIIPLELSIVQDAIGSYRSPKDKIARLEKAGEIIRLKRGLFVTHPDVSRQSLSRELIANHLYGPSYVSLQSALSYHGLIPERVNTVSSVSIKRAKSYDTPLGLFEYIRVPKGYYALGIHQEVIENEYAFLIASPEKALCDLIITSSGLRFQSAKAARAYLQQDMRIEYDEHPNWDADIVSECATYGRKSRELNFLSEVLRHG